MQRKVGATDHLKEQTVGEVNARVSTNPYANDVA